MDELKYAAVIVPTSFAFAFFILVFCPCTCPRSVNVAPILHVSQIIVYCTCRSNGAWSYHVSCILPFSRLKTRYELWHESLRVRGEFYTSIASGSRDREEYSQAECQFHGPYVTSRVEKLKFRKLRVQKPKFPVLLCSGGQSTNHGAPPVTTVAGHPRATRRPSSGSVHPSASSLPL